jgi:hypothetical protein
MRFKWTSRKIKIAFILVAAIATQLTTACGVKSEPQASCNFVQNSDQQRVSWKGTLPVQIWIHESVPAQYHAAIMQAAAQWEYSVGKKLFTVAGIDHGPLTPSQDGKNVIYWMPTWDATRPTEQARTTIFWQDNQIQEADILVNTQNFSYSTPDLVPNQVDFESLILHELGHSLGLQHDIVSGSVMAAYLASDYERRTPSDFDVTSLKCEY